MSESQLQRTIKRTLELTGHRVLRLNAGLTVLGEGKAKRAIRGCEPGTPDLMVLLRGGRCAWLEVKTPKGRVSKSQAAWHASVEPLGHHVEVVRSVDEALAAVRAAEGRW